MSVHIGNCSSSSANLTSGVPQGSILGPILFSIFMLPLGRIIQRHNISFHLYADDTQLYLPINANNPADLNRLKACLDDVKEWMAQNHLQLNDSKGEILLVGPSSAVSHLTNHLGSLSTLVKPHVRNLGVIFDSELSLDRQVSSVVQSAFYQLRIISKIKSFLTPSDLRRVIFLFIFSRLDYCNSLYTGLPDSTIHRLQLVQNAAARLVSGTKMREHISPILLSLHWLPVKKRIMFKTCVFTYKALNGLGPSYIKDLVELSSEGRPRQNLRSDDQLSLRTPRTNLVKRGGRSFAAMAPTLWNALPLDIKSAPTILSFKAKLKTHFFSDNN